MYEAVREKIEEIIEITKKCPSNLQEKCFELLLSSLLGESKFIQKDQNDKGIIPPQDKKDQFIMPIDVKAFLQQYSIKEEKLGNLFFMHGKEVRPTYTLSTTKKARGQIQIALLTALENALKNQKFQFSISSVKEKCQENKTYDGPNFRGIFKKSLRLFKSLSDPDNVELSPEGKAELAEVILGMSNS